MRLMRGSALFTIKKLANQRLNISLLKHAGDSCGAQIKSLYIDRTSRRDCHYCGVNGYINAGTQSSQRKWETRNVPQWGQAIDIGMDDVHPEPTQ